MEIIINVWLKLFLIVIGIFLVTILMKMIILTVKHKGDFDWWNTRDGKKYKNKLNMSYLLAGYSDPFLNRIYGRYMNVHKKLTNSQADFIVGNLLRYQLIMNSDGTYNGVLTPRSLCENILPEAGGSDKIYNKWITEYPTEYSLSGSGYPDIGDIKGWKDLIMTWLNGPSNKGGWYWCKQSAGSNSNNASNLWVPTHKSSFAKCPDNKTDSGCADQDKQCDCGSEATKCPSKTQITNTSDTDNDIYEYWFAAYFEGGAFGAQSYGRPDNIFARMNIMPNDPLIVYFVNNLWTVGGTYVDANAFKRATGDSGGIVSGGWLGFIQGMGDMKSSNDYANYIWTTVESQYQNPIDYSDCGKPDTKGGWLGAMGGLISGIGLALMVPTGGASAGLAATVGWGLASTTLVAGSAAVGAISGSRPAC